jgi:cell division protein FtsL
MLPSSHRSGSPSGSSPPWSASVESALPRRTGMASANSAERRALMTWLGIAAVITVSLGIGYVWVRLQVSETGYRLDALHDAIERFEQEQNDLTASASTLDSAIRVESEAAKRLGLMHATRGQELVLP